MPYFITIFLVIILVFVILAFIYYQSVQTEEQLKINEYMSNISKKINCLSSPQESKNENVQNEKLRTSIISYVNNGKIDTLSVNIITSKGRLFLYQKSNTDFSKNFKEDSECTLLFHTSKGDLDFQLIYDGKIKFVNEVNSINIYEFIKGEKKIIKTVKTDTGYLSNVILNDEEMSKTELLAVDIENVINFIKNFE